MISDEDIDAEFGTTMANLIVKGEIEYINDTQVLLTEKGWAHWEKIIDSWTHEDVQVSFLAIGVLVRNSPEIFK